MEELYRSSCLQGVSPHLFWDSTLREISLLVKAGESKDRLMWNHTASMMSLYANSKARKGKTFAPADFNPYDSAARENSKPKTKDDVIDLVKTMKSF